MVNMMQDGGPKACSYGCLGDGSCVQACPFDAIHIVNGVAVVDKEACKACGKCVAVCPKHLIEIVPYDQKHLVKCNSQDKGKAVMHGYPPTVREFGKLIGVKSTSSAFSRIKQLELNGYIRRIPASPRAIEIL